MRINATIVSVVLSKANWLEKIRPKSPFPILTISTHAGLTNKKQKSLKSGNLT